MKLGGTAFISLIALLLASVVVEGCLTLKGSGKTQVKGGNSTFYKLRIATDWENVTNATLTVTLPEGVKYDTFSSFPTRSAPSQSKANGTLLTWADLSLPAHKRSSFRIKVNVDVCAPDELIFEANVGNVSNGGSCNADAAPVTTTVTRAEGAGACDTDSIPVYTTEGEELS